MSERQPTLTIALAGQPNVGKSTVFNLLTHQNQYVSNWPGKTCEQKTGICQREGICVSIVDLPGAYSLTANSEEERIARDFLIKCRPDAVIVVVDAASLERSLYLAAELVCLPVPVVVGLNMLDMAGYEGITIEPHVLQAAMGIPVVPMVASKGQGVRDLVAAAAVAARNPQSWTPNRPEVQAGHRQVLDAIETLISDLTPHPYPPDWVALKLLEGDEEITAMMRMQLGAAWEQVHAILAQHDDAFLAVAGGRYEWIGRMVRAAVVRPKPGQVTVTDRIDQAATHPVAGLIILLCALGLLFYLTYAIGAPVQAWLEIYVVQAGAEWARTLLSAWPAWLVGLLSSGVIMGVGTVLTLLPFLLIFFSVLGLLEDVGYMARAAFVMDRFMHRMGLHGKSFLPMFLGFGCNVPAMMGTRIIESPKARLTTILVTPLVPCTARMSVVAFLAPIFFGSRATAVTLGLLALTIVVIAGVGATMHRLFSGGEHTAFIMELPLYHIPSARRIAQGVWQRLVDFLQGAGTIILVVSVVMWALSTYPGGEIETSYLAFVGRWLAPMGRLMGLDWQMMVALLTSFVRKENTLPTLAVLYSGGSSGVNLVETLRSQLSPAAGLAFLAVQILFIPCVATVATIRQETRSWGWTAFSILFLFVLSMSAGIAIFQGAAVLGWGL
ncbi:MAG: ferrous iron transport protein B [Chloroflexota bacterium]|nr:MAG: ferrous iron transport protein B [Chloroflexota bacterium]